VVDAEALHRPHQYGMHDETSDGVGAAGVLLAMMLVMMRGRC
jgi:hypothetical protein